MSETPDANSAKNQDDSRWRSLFFGKDHNEQAIVLTAVDAVGKVFMYRGEDAKAQDKFTFYVELSSGEVIKLLYDTEDEANQARNRLLFKIENYYRNFLGIGNAES